MTSRERLEKAGFKFIGKKQLGDGMTAHLYEDPDTGEMITQGTALERERAKRLGFTVARLGRD